MRKLKSGILVWTNEERQDIIEACRIHGCWCSRRDTECGYNKCYIQSPESLDVGQE